MKRSFGAWAATVLLLCGSGFGSAVRAQGVEVERCQACIPFSEDGVEYTWDANDPTLASRAAFAAASDRKAAALGVAREIRPGLEVTVTIKYTKQAFTDEMLLSIGKKTDAICDGVMLPLARYTIGDTNGLRAQDKLVSTRATLCIGTVTTVDEFRERPYKKFFDAEKKAFLESVSRIEQLATADAIKSVVKELLETDLKTQRAAWVGETAAEVVKVLGQPAPKKN